MNKIKPALKGFGGIFFFFGFQYLYSILISILVSKINFSFLAKNIILLLGETIIAIVMIILNKERLKKDYPDFNKNIIAYASVPGYQTNEIENVKIIKSKLEYLLNRSDNPDLCNNQNNPGITISNVNNNNNTNSINFSMNIEDIKANIEENTYLSDYDKEELLNKLEEIVELQKSKDSKSKKWDKAKKILAFLLDKGADIAIMYIPQILKAISN